MAGFGAVWGIERRIRTGVRGEHQAIQASTRHACMGRIIGSTWSSVKDIFEGDASQKNAPKQDKQIGGWGMAPVTKQGIAVLTTRAQRPVVSL